MFLYMLKSNFTYIGYLKIDKFIESMSAVDIARDCEWPGNCDVINQQMKSFS